MKFIRQIPLTWLIAVAVVAAGMVSYDHKHGPANQSTVEQTIKREISNNSNNNDE